MNGISISPEITQRLAGSLLHFFWEGALIAMFTALSLRLLSRRSAEARYAVSIAGLLLMVAAPILTFMTYAEIGKIAEQTLQRIGEITVSAPKTSEGADTTFWIRSIVFVWFAGVGLCLLRLIVAWLFSLRLVRTATLPVPPQVMHLFEWVKEELNFRHALRLLVSGRIGTPAVVGWLRPCVLLPVAALTGLGEDHLRAIFVHELAHIRRHDFLVNTLQRCVESVLFYHPAVWWLSARTREERERCCDDLAVRICGDPLVYAQALIALERVRNTSGMTLAVTATGGPLTQRVHRILGRETVNQDWQSAVAALLFVLAWVLTGVWQSSTLNARELTPLPLRPAAPVFASSPIAAALQSIAAIVTAQPVSAEPWQSQFAAASSSDATKGSIQGIVTMAGSADPISNVQITLETPADTQMSLASKPNGPQAIEDLFAALTPLGISRTNMPQAAPLPEERVMTNIASNAPVSGVAVLDPDLLSALRKFRATTSSFKTITDSNGRFRINDLPPAQYTIRAEHEGYFGSRTEAANAAVEVKTTNVVAGQMATASLSLIQGGTLVGHVRDGNNQPVSRAFVQSSSVNYVDGIPRLDGAGIAVTDDRGEYRMFWLPTGDYFISVSTQPVGNPNAARRMPPAATVTTTDVPPARTYFPGTIDFSKAVSVSLNPGRTVDAGDFVIQSARTFNISGIINSTVPPARNAATVQAVLQLAPRSSGLSEPIRQSGNSILDPVHGQFSIAGLLPGSYDLYARVPSALGGNAWGHVPVDVTDKDVAGLVLEIAPTVTVPGTIRVNGGAPMGAGLRLELLAEGVFGKLADLNVRMGAQRTFKPESDGSFSITNVPPAHYRMDVQGLLPSQYVSDIRQGGASVFDAGFDVGRENPGALQMILSEGAGTLTGMVRDSMGKPLPNASVALVPIPSRRLNWTLYRQAVSDTSGHVVLRSIAPGEYKLFVLEGAPAGAFFDPKFLEKYEARGISVRVSESSTSNLDLIAIPPGR